MKASKSSGLKPAGLGLCFVALLLVIAAVATLESFQAAPESAAATYSRGTLHMTIPYDLPRAGAGQLAVEVLDPEDQILGHSEWPVEARAGKGSWQEDLRLTKAVGTDDLVWNRLRYRFTYGGQKDSVLENTESISQILRTPVMHILGQQSYLTGGQAGRASGGDRFEE